MSPQAPPDRLPANGDASWEGTHVVVAGLRVAGFAAADALLRRGAVVTVVDARTGEDQQRRREVLEARGARVRLGEAETLPGGVDLLVVSPGFRPGAPVAAAAREAGVPVWGDVELAWRLRPGTGAAPWLTLTGTNGKTTTTRMLAAMLQAAGHRAAAVGNIGVPVLDAIAEGRYDVLAVELSSFELHWAHQLRPYAAALLNVAADHIDWHGSFAEYTRTKGRVYQGSEVAVVYNADDPVTERLARDADVQDGCRAVGFTLGVPEAGELGVVHDALVDRAFVSEPHSQAAQLATVSDVPAPGRHNLADALAAAALARAFGVPPRAVSDGLRGVTLDPHRIERVAVVGGVEYVDDSKATNGHAALASLEAFGPVVWVAGGLAKGARFDDLVARVASRLVGAVLFGADRALLRDALARHAPQVPVVEVADTDSGVMDSVVRAAAGLARPGDTVLLAPACASMDLFPDYAARGDAFASAVRGLAP